MKSLRNSLVVLVLILLALAPGGSAASTPQPPAMPRDYVVDLAGVLSSDVQNRMNAYLQELEQKTGAQVVVLTVQSLDGQSIEEFSFNTKEQWRLGQKGRDNGVLITLAIQDRKYRFEIGYGLEEVLPDSMVGTIGRQYLVPYLKEGDYNKAIYAATIAVANTIAAHEGVEISGMPRLMPAQGTGGGQPVSLFQTVIFGIMLLAAIILFITHPRQCFLFLLASSLGGRNGRWSGGGFGGFGGGGGSFGGGGGGSGGGGGASGSW
jgi:uncharacterized protein